METSVNEIRERSLPLRILLACGAAGPLFFVIMFWIEGATRPGYSPLRQPVSSLSIGAMGWTQITNFLITGSLVLAFAIGVWRMWPSPSGPWLIGLVGLGLIGSGLFVTDPLNGYPPGTPLLPVERTTHGILHDLFGIPVFLGLPIACLVFGRQWIRMGERGWSAYSTLSGLGMFGIFFLARLGFKQIGSFGQYAGLFQRLSLVVGFTWLALLAIKMFTVPQVSVSADQKSNSTIHPLTG